MLTFKWDVCSLFSFFFVQEIDDFISSFCCYAYFELADDMDLKTVVMSNTYKYLRIFKVRVGMHAVLLKAITRDT